MYTLVGIIKDLKAKEMQGQVLYKRTMTEQKEVVRSNN